MTGKLLLAAGAVFSFAVTGAAIPLPEHPRPDWERAEWLNLNGEWDFGFSATNLDRRIVVPFSWGSRLSGINDEAGTEGDTGYYRRSVIVPKAWRGRRVFVVVGAADHDTTCVFDGHELGQHSGGYTPFEFELTPHVKWGRAQTLSFSVWDAPGGSDGRLFAKQCYGNVRGIWQTVYLEARGEAYLDSVRLTPSIARKSVKAELALDAPAAAPLTAHIRLDGRTTDVAIAAGERSKDREYREETQRRVAEAYARAKRLDPTRLVEDNSATWHDHVATDVNTWHRYRPGSLWERTVAEWCDGTFPGSPRNFIGGRRQNDAPMMNSECGNVWGYTGSTGDCDFSWDYHLMMNAFSRHLKCAGWTYTEHHDVINEWNGYVRDDRSPKFDGMDELAGMTLADFHRDAALFFAGTPGRETGEFLAPGQEIAIPVGVSLTTDKYAGKALELVVSGGSFETKAAKSWQCETLWTHRFVAPSAPACGVVVFKLKADGKEIARNFWSFGVTNAAPATVVASRAEWSGGTTNVLGGLKLNGFGKGFFEFDLAAPATGGVFRAELSSRPITAKDLSALGAGASELECVTGGGFRDRTKSANSYPMTSTERHPSRVRIVIGGRTMKELTLENDPCDHRGILSWLSQPQDGRLYEAGTYGWLVEAPVPAEAVKGGRVTVRVEADNGLAVYGPRFGRYPVGPGVSPFWYNARMHDKFVIIEIEPDCAVRI